MPGCNLGLKEGAFGTKTPALGFSMDKNKEISVKALPNNVVRKGITTAKIFEIEEKSPCGTETSLICVPFVKSLFAKESGLFLPGAYYPGFDTKHRLTTAFGLLTSSSVSTEKEGADLVVSQQKLPISKDQEAALVHYFETNKILFFRSSVPQTEPEHLRETDPAVPLCPEKEVRRALLQKLDS